MNHIAQDNKIMLRIDKGEYINKTILDVASFYNLKFGWINGLGAIMDPELGYYDLKNKEYIKKTIIGEFELTSLVGNLTLKEGDLFVHSHITFSDINFNAYGGHLFDCKIAVAGEFLIFRSPTEINRKYDDEIGLYTWSCKID
tara:strand:- start:67 stop:495 length:429 start_codon:yes stop_codon:yes gene_type:complete